MPAERERRALRLEDFVDQALVELLKQALLQAVHVRVDLLDQREIRVHRLIDDGVHRRFGAPGEEVGAALQPLAHGLAAQRRHRMHRDEKVLTEEIVEVEGLEIVGIRRGAFEPDASHDHEYVAVVFLQLDAGPR